MDEVSCFETLRVYGGRLFKFGEHFDRLSESCRALNRALPLEAVELKHWTLEAVRESGWKDCLVRLSVHWDAASGGAVVAMVREFVRHEAALYRAGVSLKTVPTRRSTLKAQDPQIKASQFVGGVMAVLEKGGDPAHELLLLGPSGDVAEGTVSNIFIVKQKRILTPSVSSGILRGVTRGFVMELAKNKDLPVVETFLSRHEVYTADECFMTNTSSEVLPVVCVDRRVIGSGKPGPVTRLLAGEFKKNRGRYCQ